MTSPFGTLAADSDPPRLWVGQSIPRVEDPALLTGRGRFIDDIGTRPDTLHAAILRSPHPHADVVGIDTVAARGANGVAAVLTGDDVKALTSSLVVGVKASVECWPIAVGRVRYVGEPVAVVVASDRYLAEDAVDLIDVQYRVRPSVVDPLLALAPDAPILHDGFSGNVASDRTFRYGDPERAFAEAPRRIAIDIRYPRNSCTPIETYGVVAEYDAAESAFDILANFQGPFSIHAVISRALKVPGNRLRLRTPPDSGGSFGVKQGVFPYIVLIGAASRLAGRPVKWIEDRLEHLTGSVSATNRVTTIAGAVAADGKIMALDWDQVEDCGAHLRAPEPATLYRMHGNLTGAYDIRHLSVRNRVVVTNKNSHGPEPRIWRSAGLFRAGAACAEDRGRTRPRPARRDQAQPHPVRRIPIPDSDWSPARFRGLSESGGSRSRAGRAGRVKGSPGRGPRQGEISTASATPPW